MRIIVLVKQVPDTWEDRTINTHTGWLDREASERVIDEIGERALEVALAHRDAHGDTEIIALTMGPPEATSALKKALSMGADFGVHVVDDALAGADALRTSAVLAAAATATGFDLIIAGNESTDGRGGVIPSMLAERLGLPAVTLMTSVELSADAVSGHRATDLGTMTVRAPLPAIISITEALPDARFPSFKGILTAKKKPVTTYTLADLGPGDLDDSRTRVLSAEQRPPRSGGTVVVDEGTAGADLADYLASARLI